MLLRSAIIAIFISSYALAASLVFESGKYYIFNKDRNYRITYNGEPEIVREDKSMKGLTVIEYLSGDFGTSSAERVYHRLVIFDKTAKRLIDYPFNHEGSDSNLRWKFNQKKKLIEVFRGSRRIKKVKY